MRADRMLMTAQSHANDRCPPTEGERARGVLGSLKVRIELDQPREVTVRLGALSVHNATLGSMPPRALTLRGRGGNLLANLRIDVEGGASLARDPSLLSERVRAAGAGLYLTLERLQIEVNGSKLHDASQP